jgi:putative flippase GtrA
VAALLKHAVQKLLRIQFVRFLVVGAINMAFGYAVFALLIFLGLHYSLASLLATIIGVLFNFRTYGRLVFNDTRAHLLFKFVTVYAFVYLCYVSGLRVLTQMDINDYLAGALMAVPVSFIAFMLNKRFVFRGQAS